MVVKEGEALKNEDSGESLHSGNISLQRTWLGKIKADVC